jgi:hypothetical protein
VTTPDGEGKLVPYRLIFAWGWAILFGCFNLLVVESPRYGLAALYPSNLLITFARLLCPLVVLLAPTLPIALREWRKSKSPLAGALLALLVLIVVLMVARTCQSPEPLRSFGSWGTSAQREEAKQATDRLEERFLKIVETPSDQSDAVASSDSFGEMGVKSHGFVGEIERLLIGVMDDCTEMEDEYQHELEAIGWNSILDPTRLHSDTNLVESHAIYVKAKEVVQRYRARHAAILKAMSMKIADWNIDPNLKQEMRQAFDESAKSWQPKIDRTWDLEEQALDEVGNALNLLGGKSGSWTVVKGVMLFKADQRRSNSRRKPPKL